jgi:gliding motility-associated-like protein
MKIRIPILSFFLLLPVTVPLFSQDVTQPEAPVLDYVKVNPAIGIATLYWISSVSSDVELYVVYSYYNNTAYPIDTLKDKYAVTYADYSSQARYKSVKYVVAAMDSSENISPLSNNLGTVYLTAINDSCNNRISLQWNECINQRHPVTKYSVSCSVNGAASVVLDTVDLLYYDLNGYQTGKKYCFYVTALNDEGVVSVSNMQCIQTSLEKAPDWVDLTSLRVENPVISITGSYDPEGDITLFNVEKKTSASNIWSQVTTGNGTSGTVGFSDVSPDTSIISLYRISAINNCGTEVKTSYPARNIVLTVSRYDNEIFLRWNNPFPGENSYFTILRNTGNGFVDIASALTDTVYTDDYSTYGYEVNGEKITYRVTALRIGAPAGTLESQSSAAVIITIENIYAANAFTPNGDGKNDLFFPLMSFTPLSYDFNIYSRHGVMIYHSKIPGMGWDGRHNGELMPPGVYLWTLKVKTLSGETENRNGTVSILP